MTTAPTMAVSRKFRQFVLNKYPALEGNAPFLRFFHYLCFGRFFDDDSHHLVIPTKKIAEDFYQKAYTTRFKGQEALEDFRAKVLPDMRWTRHERFASAWRGKAREISQLGFDAEMQQALHDECLNPSEDQVDFVTGEPCSRKDRYRVAAEETALYENEIAQISLNPTQTLILDYLREINAGHLFLRKLHENESAIKAAIATLKPAVQETRYRIVSAVYRNPNVYYAPSANERTCRLSPKGDGILGLKKIVRQAATKGWWECDLQSSQFAILAAKLKAPISQAFIASGKSLWREFNLFLFGIEEDPTDAVKKVLKEAIYSLCFGRSEERLKEVLGEHGFAPLLTHPILQELLALRKTWFEQIRKDGGAFDVWGQWQALDDTRDPRTGKRRWEGSVAASVIQSVEMEIIAPIFDVAAKYGESDQFKICLFQHDGCTISFNSTEKTSRAQGKLKKAVEDRARELGVATSLDFKAL